MMMMVMMMMMMMMMVVMVMVMMVKMMMMVLQQADQVRTCLLKITRKRLEWLSLAIVLEEQCCIKFGILVIKQG